MVLKWNSNIESVIHVIEKQSKLLKKIHMEVSINEYWKYSFFMNAAIIISPLPGLISVLGTILCKDLQDTIFYNSSAAILSFFTTVIVSIIKFNKYDEVGYEHKAVSSKYTSLEQNIKRQLMLGRDERVNVKDYLSWILKSYDDLFSTSPFLPSDFMKKYNKVLEELEKDFEKKEIELFYHEHKDDGEEYDGDHHRSKEEDKAFKQYYIDEDIKNHTTINFKESYTKKNKNINKNSDHDLSKFDDEKMRCDLKK